MRPPDGKPLGRRLDLVRPSRPEPAERAPGRGEHVTLAPPFLFEGQPDCFLADPEGQGDADHRSCGKVHGFPYVRVRRNGDPAQFVRHQGDAHQLEDRHAGPTTSCSEPTVGMTSVASPFLPARAVHRTRWWGRASVSWGPPHGQHHQVPMTVSPSDGRAWMMSAAGHPCAAPGRGGTGPGGVPHGEASSVAPAGRGCDELATLRTGRPGDSAPAEAPISAFAGSLRTTCSALGPPSPTWASTVRISSERAFRASSSSKGGHRRRGASYGARYVVGRHHVHRRPGQPRVPHGPAQRLVRRRRAADPHHHVGVPVRGVHGSVPPSSARGRWSGLGRRSRCRLRRGLWRGLRRLWIDGERTSGRRGTRVRSLRERTGG